MERDDDLLDEVMHKLKSALGDFDTDRLRDAVRQGLDEAMHAIDPHRDDPTHEATDAEERGENVVVLEPRRDPSGVTPAATPSTSTPRVSVRVTPQSLDDGRVHVRGEWQTLWSGERVVPYRLACDDGHLTVTVDDRTVAQLVPGQTADLEGRAIRVSGDGRGRYRRL